MKKLPFSFALALLALLAHSVHAQGFLPGPNPITGTVGTQTLSSGTGTINSGGAISISSNGVALSMNGTSTLVNNGTIQTTGSGRAIDSNASSVNLTVTNNGLISSLSTDAFRVDTNATVALTNSGTIRVTAGGQAIDWAAITNKSNVLNNLAGGLISAVGEDAVRPGNGGIINNAGTISATLTGATEPSGSDGIDLRVQKNVTVNNTGTISGRHGIATDGANAGPSSLTVNNNAGTISALNGSGLNVDGVSTFVTANVTNAFGATIKGGVSAAATEGDGDGIDIDGVLTLQNSGDVLGLGSKGGTNNAEGIAAGGGGIINTATGRIIGSSLAADAPNGDVTKAGNGILIDDSNGGNAIAVTTVTNAGLIQGKTGHGIRFIGSFGDTITNQSGGIIRGTGATATVQTGAGDDTVNNSGTIQHDTGGTAVALEGGNDTMNINGGSAVISGHINGGTGTNTLNVNAGAGQTFTFAHQIAAFNTVNVGPGTFRLTSTATVDALINVNNGGILAGTGHALQSVALKQGGTISAGNSPGTLFIDGNLNVESGSNFIFELGSIPAGSDLVAVSGVLNFAGPGTIVFDIVDAGLQLGIYDLITFAGSSGLSLANLQLGNRPAGFSGTFLLDGNSVSLIVSAIPEPSTTAAIFGSLALAAAAFRRNQIRRAQRVANLV